MKLIEMYKNKRNTGKTVSLILRAIEDLQRDDGKSASVFICHSDGEASMMMNKLKRLNVFQNAYVFGPYVEQIMDIFNLNYIKNGGIVRFYIDEPYIFDKEFQHDFLTEIDKQDVDMVVFGIGTSDEDVNTKQQFINYL